MQTSHTFAAAPPQTQHTPVPVHMHVYFCTHSEESWKHSKQPYKHAKEPCIHSNEPYVSCCTASKATYTCICSYSCIYTQKSPTCTHQSPIFSEQTLTYTQKSKLYPQKSTTYTQKSLVSTQKRPTLSHTRKRALNSKQAYTLSHTRKKRPTYSVINAKEPYTQKRPIHSLILNRSPATRRRFKLVRVCVYVWSKWGVGRESVDIRLFCVYARVCRALLRGYRALLRVCRALLRVRGKSDWQHLDLQIIYFPCRINWVMETPVYSREICCDILGTPVTNYSKVTATPVKTCLKFRQP